MLRACHRILKPGGRIAFFVIATGDGLTADQAERVKEVGPEYALADPGYEDLMKEVGFRAVTIEDVSDQYLSTYRAWNRAWDREASEISNLIGAEEFADRQATRREEIAMIADGLLKRHLATGTRP